MWYLWTASLTWFQLHIPFIGSVCLWKNFHRAFVCLIGRKTIAGGLRSWETVITVCLAWPSPKRTTLTVVWRWVWTWSTPSRESVFVAKISFCFNISHLSQLAGATIIWQAVFESYSDFCVGMCVCACMRETCSTIFISLLWILRWLSLMQSLITSHRW